MDTVTPLVRSFVMSRVKSKRNRSTEWRLRGLLVRRGLRGWEVNPEDLPGAPDFVFRAERVVIFTDGCFWHGCPRCKKIPSSNVSYWDGKISKNRKRDKATSAELRRQRWTVLRFWEHDLVSLDVVAHRIEKALYSSQNASRFPNGSGRPDMIESSRPS
jgi:DNA mismatch endonuclease (patch repair protein)